MPPGDDQRIVQHLLAYGAHPPLGERVSFRGADGRRHDPDHLRIGIFLAREEATSASRALVISET
jgi:hypothetical protein